MTATATLDRPGSGPAPVRRGLGLALAVICAAQLMVVLDATIVNIALPSMQRQLHFSTTNLQWVLNAYTLAFGGLLLLGGRAGDILGRRKVFLAGIALFTLASLAGGLATGQAWLIIARVVQGVGAAIASPTALSLVATNFPEGRPRNRAMGVYAAMSGSGAAVGLLAGGVLTDVASWRWVLFVNVPIGLVVLLLAPRVLHDTPGNPGRFDLPGALSATAGLTLLVYGLTHAASVGWSSPVTLATLALAVAALVAFVLIEARSPHALVPLRIFANRNRSASYLMMLCIGAALFSMFYFLTQFVQNILDYSPLRAGVAFLPVTAGIMIAAGLVSRVLPRTGVRSVTVLGAALAALGLLLMSRLTVHSSYVGGLLIPMLVLAVGMGLTFVPLTLTAVAGVRDHDAGLASALLNTAQQIGGSLGLAVLVTVATSVTKHRVAAVLGSGGRAALTPPVLARAVTHGYTTSFDVAAGLGAVALVIALVAIRVRRDELPAAAAH